MERFNRFRDKIGKPARKMHLISPSGNKESPAETISPGGPKQVLKRRGRLF
jgi:hypothetical protein